LPEQREELETNLMSGKELENGTDLESVPSLGGLELAVRQAARELAELRDANRELHLNNQGLMDELESLRKELSQQQAQIGSLEESVKALATEKESLRAKKEEIARRLERLFEQFDWLVEC